MRLICVGRYRSGAGSFEPGQAVDVSDEEGAFLLRDSPTSFRVEEAIPASDEGEAVAGDSTAEPDLSAMSTETQSGLIVPDRRARGGKKREA